MIHPSWKSILTNPIAKTLAVAIGGSIFTALDSVAQQMIVGSVNGVQIGAIGTLAAYLIHNFLSFERDRVFGETAYPPIAQKTIVPTNVTAIAHDYAPPSPSFAASGTMPMRRKTDTTAPSLDAPLHEHL